MKTLGALVLVLFLGACQTTGSFCDLAEPIRLPPEAVDAMTLEQVREAVEHDRIGAAQCGWRPTWHSVES